MNAYIAIDIVKLFESLGIVEMHKTAVTQEKNVVLCIFEYNGSQIRETEGGGSKLFCAVSYQK